jgi:hypothetical protein
MWSPVAEAVSAKGRWPANVILDDEAAALLDAQSGERKSGPRSVGAARRPRVGRAQYGNMAQSHVGVDNYGDAGGASRFFHRANSRAEVVDLLTRLITPPGGVVLYLGLRETEARKQTNGATHPNGDGHNDS